MTGVITRGKLLRGDLALWDGKTIAASRIDATGGTVTGLAFGNEVDVLQVYGNGTARTRGTIDAAIRSIGTSPCTLAFAPGTWTIDDDISIPFNFRCHIPPGVTFDVASGKTLTFLGEVDAEYPGAWKTGAGSIASAHSCAYVRSFGARGDGTTDDTAAIQAAIDTGWTVVFEPGTYLCNNLTQSTDFQHFIGIGYVVLKKNANGAHFTSTGSDVELEGIQFRGDAASPVYTGNGIVSTGNNFRLINCGSRWCPGYAVLATGSHCQILGTNDIYQTTDATANGYDIVIGVSGTATLYHRVYGTKSSQSTGGIKFIDCGGQYVSGNQTGKINISAGTLPAGVNGGNYTGNRVLGNITASVSSSAWAANTIGAVTITFGAGTSGHRFDRSNALDASATITDNSTSSVVEDSRDVPYQSYTPSWTAASVNPAIGNGTITGRYSKTGKRVDVSVRISMGSSTTYGTGIWYISLPFVPTTAVYCNGISKITDSGTAFYVGVVETLLDGTARCQVYVSGGSNAISSTAPMTWAVNDELHFSLTYYTD